MNGKITYTKKFGLSKIISVTCCIICCLTISLRAQTNSNAEYRVKAVFLYNFTRFVEWPPVSFTSPDSPFIIGIVGDDPFGSYLEEAVHGENIDQHPILIRHYMNAKDVSGCHILFINSEDPEFVKEVLSITKNHPVLTVSESFGFMRIGGIVRFYTEDNKIKIQINPKAAKDVQLNISSKLLSVAKLY